jgi:hypothetical protein
MFKRRKCPFCHQVGGQQKVRVGVFAGWTKCACGFIYRPKVEGVRY